MNVSLLLQGYEAKRKLSQLFQSEGLGQANHQSTAIVTRDSIPAIRIDIEQNGKPFREICREHGLVRSRTPTALPCRKKEIPKNPAVHRWLFIMPQDWTWWVWLVMACLFLIGLVGLPGAFLAALLFSSAQSVLFLARERAVKAFSVASSCVHAAADHLLSSSDPLALLAARSRHVRACCIRILSNSESAFTSSVESHRADHGRFAAANISVPPQITGSPRQYLFGRMRSRPLFH
jgi:hypothetical protein